MTNMKILPKDFIKRTLIDEMKDIVARHPYLSFSLISSGIEFLGKCMLTEYKQWELPREEIYRAYEKGIEIISDVDNRYAEIKNFKNELRNSLIHSFLPGAKISLSEVKAGDNHFSKDDKGKTILVAEIFYRDFVLACKKVLARDFDADDKMEKYFLHIYDNKR